MSEEVKTTELTTEERAAMWTKSVKDEVNVLLDSFLSKALDVNINVKYSPHVIEVQESGPVVDVNKADGVLLSIVLEFEAPIELNKPRE